MKCENREILGLFDSLRKLNEGFLVKCYEFLRIGVPGPICSSEITSLFKFINRPSRRSLLLCSRLSDLFAVKSGTKTVKICNFGKFEKLKEISWELKRPQQDFKKLRLFRSPNTNTIPQHMASEYEKPNNFNMPIDRLSYNYEIYDLTTEKKTLDN